MLEKIDKKTVRIEDRTSEKISERIAKREDRTSEKIDKTIVRTEDRILEASDRVVISARVGTGVAEVVAEGNRIYIWLRKNPQSLN